MIKRTIFSDIQGHLDAKEITLITGPRQAGKTTILLQLKDELEKQGKKVMDLNFDIENDKRYIVSQNTLVQEIQKRLGSNGGYVFLDEIQRKANAGIFLKGLYDMRLPYKFVVTGSGSLELKENIHESLAGRKLIFELSTLTFEEFSAYRKEGRVQEPTQGELLDEYLRFGGYPRVVLEPTESGKRRIMGEIYQSYLEKDLMPLIGANKTEAFIQLTRILADQAGKLVNITELSSTLDIASATVKQYLWYLEKTFILRRATPFFRNARKEITKTPLFYFLDLGLRNYSATTFGNSLSSATGGFLFQNFVFNILRTIYADTAATIHFWRTKDKSEVDIIVNRGTDQLPIEVKYSALEIPGIPRSLQSFITKYKPPQALIVHLGKRFETTLDTTRVIFLPYDELISPNIKDLIS